MRVVSVGSYDRGFNRNILVDRLLAQMDDVEPLKIPATPLKGDRLELWAHHRAATVIRLVPALIRLFSSTLIDSLRHPGTKYLVRYPGYFDVPVVRLAASVRGGSVIYDPFISLYDTIVNDRRLVSTRSWLATAVKAVDALALRSANHVISDTPQTGEYLAKLSGCRRDKFSTVWIGADEQTFFPPGPDDIHRARADLFAEVGLEPIESPFVVLYYGNYIPLHGIDQVIRAAALAHPRVRFIFVGDGQTLAANRQLADELKLTNIYFLKRRSPEGIRQLIWGSDLLLGVFGSSEKARRVLPNKLMEGMACRQVVLTATTPATVSSLDTILTTGTTASEIANVINGLAVTRSLDHLRSRARAEYAEKFSEPVRRMQLHAVITRVHARTKQ